MPVQAQNYPAVASLYAAGGLKFKEPETVKRPGKPNSFQIMVDDSTQATFQLWTPTDGAQYPQAPFGVSEPLSVDPSGRKKTLEMSIESPTQQAFLRDLDNRIIAHLTALSPVLWNEQRKPEDIVKNCYTRVLRKDAAYGEASLDKNGKPYNPCLRTHWYIGARQRNKEGKDTGCHASVIYPAKPPPAGTVIDHTFVKPFDYVIPVVRFVGLYFVQGKWSATFITESVVHIPNQRQQTVVPNVDISSLALPTYVDPAEYGENFAAGANNAGGGGGMIFGTPGGGGASFGNDAMVTV
jgi:hypothetical protein